jgi:hypothetical protein
MDQLTRRRFLGWTSAGAAGAGLLALAPRLGLGGSGQGAPTAMLGRGVLGAEAVSGPAQTDQAPVRQPLPAFAQPMVAYVHNAASGELSLMVGTQEMTIHDPDLVARLFQRAGSGR